jgi:hypothetical protein
MTSLKKKHNQWDRQLKQWFLDNGITYCESCSTTRFLTVMHALKRRFILTKEDYFRAAVICQPEHHFWEYGDSQNPGTHDRMAAFVDRIIEQRAVQRYVRI